MSARATFWAWRVAGPFELNPTERLVLLCLADGADKISGECWYKIATIGESTGLSRSGVQRPLRSLSEKGLIRIESVTKEGRSLANSYFLNLDVEKPCTEGCHTDAPVPREEGAPGMRVGAAEGCTSYPSSETDPALRADSAREARAKSFEEGFDEFWTSYPRKIAKKGALKVYATARKSRLLPPLSVLLAAVQRQGQKLGWFDGSCPDDKIPYPRTWLAQERWNDEVEVKPRSVSRPAAQPPSPPVDRALEEAKDRAIAQIRSTVLTAADGWHGSARSLIETLIQDAPDVATISAICPAALALDGRLRTLGAYPLRRPGVHDDWLPGLLLSKSGSKWRVTWNGEAFEVSPILDKLALPINCPEGCPDGGPCKSWPEPCPRQFENARECECEACATGDGPCRETIASALAFCMDESFGDGPTTQVANKRSRAVVDQEESAARKHEATQVFANKAVESYNGPPVRCYVDNAGLRHCPRGGYHRPSFSDGGLRCSNCKTSLTEARFDNRLCPGGSTLPSETGHHECAITIDDPAGDNPSPEAVEAAYSRVAALGVDPRVKISPGGVLGIPRPPTQREIEYGQRLAAEGAGLSSAELAAIDPPNPDFFEAVSKLPPLDVSGFKKRNWNWTGPEDADLQPDGQTLKSPVPGERWPYGPPEGHEGCCGLHGGGLFCDCKASAHEDDFS